jgi:hypothetical protein
MAGRFIRRVAERTTAKGSNVRLADKRALMLSELLFA